LYLIFIEEKKHKEFIIFFLTSLLVSSFLANIVIKNLVRRTRPFSTHPISTDSHNFHQFPLILTNYPFDYSFPSGHAATSFAAATILAYFDKKRKKLFYLIAVLIAFSRVYLGYHYFLDVIVGAMLGYLISKFILLFYVKHAKQRKTMR
jgi:undecaprenyl-diphosphatase